MTRRPPFPSTTCPDCGHGYLSHEDGCQAAMRGQDGRHGACGCPREFEELNFFGPPWYAGR